MIVLKARGNRRDIHQKVGLHYDETWYHGIPIDSTVQKVELHVYSKEAVESGFILRNLHTNGTCGCRTIDMIAVPSCHDTA